MHIFLTRAVDINYPIPRFGHKNFNSLILLPSSGEDDDKTHDLT